MTTCPTGNPHRRGCILGVCLLAAALFLLATPTRAGVLDSWEGSRENANLITKLLRERIVEPGLEILRRSTDTDAETLLRETDDFFATAKRKTGETARRVVANHLKAAADRIGFGKVTGLGSSIKEKVVDKAAEKVAGFVTDKAWNAAESATDTLASRQRREGSAAGGEARQGSEAESSEDRIPAGAETEDQDEADAGAGAGTRPGAVDPLIALDVHEEEREWYRTETGVLDRTPLPEVEVAVAGSLEDTGGYAYGEAGRDCEDDWADCPGEGYWNEELQRGARRIDPWVDYRRPADGAQGGSENRYAAADDPGGGGERACEDDWADCPETGLAGGDGDRNGAGGGYRPADAGDSGASPGGGYAAALAELMNEGRAPSGHGSTESTGGYQAALDRLEDEAERRRRRQEAELTREREAAERASERASASSSRGTPPAPSGSGEQDDSGHATLSSNCEEDVAPACEQAVRTANTHIARLRAALQSASISRQRTLVAQAATHGLTAARTCHSLEKRPHCKEMYQRGIRELEQTLRSAR